MNKLGARLKVQVSGVKNVIKNVHGSKLRIIENIKGAIAQAGLFLEGEVKSSVAGQRDEKRSVDTGRFLNSVKSSSEGLEARVVSNVDYAAFLEFGTSRFPERAHFRNSVARHRRRIVAFVRAAAHK